MQEAKVENMETTSNLPATQEEGAMIPSLQVDMYKMEITAQQIRQYIAPSDATSADIAFFLGMSKSLGLNPFANEIYMIPFKGKDGRKYAGVVAYTVMIDRADASGVLEGIEIEMDDEENPTKCTVSIHRRGWKIPFKRTTLMSEAMRIKYDGNPMALWATRPRQMLEKCAVTAALRMAIPSCRRMPYIGEELRAEPGQYVEPDLTQLSEAKVVSASAVDIDYLRGQYFKYGKDVWADDDARHEWNVANGFKESVTVWEVRDFERAIDILDPDIGQYYEPPTEEEAARMEAELGKDDATDGAQGASGATDAPDPAMDSADALDSEIRAKLKRITDLLPAAIKSYEEAGFQTWAWGILDDDLKGTPIHELGVLDLDILIGAMEVREDKQADAAAEENGLF